jgi:hypothetical protein
MSKNIGDATRSWFDRLIANAVENFDGRSTLVEMNEGEDVEFHKVGRNATHEFWVGILTDGRIVLRTVGEGEWMVSRRSRQVCGLWSQARCRHTSGTSRARG